MAARFFVLLQVSAFTGIGACLLWLLRKFLAHYPAKWRYALLLLLGVRLLIPFRLSLPAAPVQVEVPAQVGARILWFVSENVGLGQNAQDGAGTVQGTAMDAKFAAESDTTAEDTAGGESTKTLTLGQLTVTEGVMLIWAAGVMITLGNRICGSLVWRRRVLRYAVLSHEDTMARACEIAGEIGVRCPLVLTVRKDADAHSVCPSPMLLGVFRPVLLLPEQAAETEFALRHELTHLYHRDLYAKLVMTFAVSVHWFNPLVRLLERQFSEAMECACDEQVLAHADAAMRRAYSEAILAGGVRRRMPYPIVYRLFRRAAGTAAQYLFKKAPPRVHWRPDCAPCWCSGPARWLPAVLLEMRSRVQEICSLKRRNRRPMP